MKSLCLFCNYKNDHGHPCGYVRPLWEAFHISPNNILITTFFYAVHKAISPFNEYASSKTDSSGCRGYH